VANNAAFQDNNEQQILLLWYQFKPGEVEMALAAAIEPEAETKRKNGESIKL
jgi:hypothetical protein